MRQVPLMYVTQAQLLTADCLLYANEDNETAALWRGVTLGAAVLFMKRLNI